MDVFSKASQFELELFARKLSDDIIVKTVFFGGGTPTVMPSDFFTRMLNSLSENYPVSESLEVTCEANPNTINKKYCSELVRSGINRLSIGMQASDDRELEILGRTHDQRVVNNAIRDARSSGFRNINLDLIYGIPTQSLKSRGSK